MPLTVSSSLNQVIEEINSLRNAHTAAMGNVPNIGVFNALNAQVQDLMNQVQALQHRLQAIENRAAPEVAQTRPTGVVTSSAMPPVLVEPAAAPATPTAATAPVASTSAPTIAPSVPASAPTLAVTNTSSPAATTSSPAAATTASPSPAPNYDNLRTALRAYSAIHGIPAAQALLTRVSGRSQVPQVPVDEIARVLQAIQAESRVG